MLSERQLASAAKLAAAGARQRLERELAEDEENIVIDMAEEEEEEEEDEDEDAQEEDAEVEGDEEQQYAATIRSQHTDNNHLLAADELHSFKMPAFEAGDLVWFDPNLLGYRIPGKVLDSLPDLCVLTVEGRQQPAANLQEPEAHNQALVRADEEARLELYELNEVQQLATLLPRAPFVDERGVGDLVELEERSLESIVWNLKLRHKKELVYTRCGLKMLVSVNPHRQLANLYNLDQVNLYDTTTPSAGRLGSLAKGRQPLAKRSEQLLRWLLLSRPQEKLPRDPHIFGLANEVLRALLVSGQDQCILLLGESGSGKTESCKLLAQYLATVNKSPSNLITEQILESIQLLESFGNARTRLNDNSSRFGKLLEIRFQLRSGLIASAKTNYLNLLDRSRIVAQCQGERNYHIFYELLAGLSRAEREKYGLQTADKYFYLNQGQCFEVPSKEDGQDFRSLLASMQVLGFNYEEQDAIFRILASILHLGNIYFHRKLLAHRPHLRPAAAPPSVLDHQTGVEGVEIGSDNELRWISHLLQIQFEAVAQCLTSRRAETHSGPGGQTLERILVPLNIDQALDSRDAMARALYGYLFKWLVQRINAMTGPKQEPTSNNLTLNQDSIYLCQTSESLCEFQPDKLRASTASSGNHLPHLKTASLSILDAFGFESLSENNFEQLCINSASELLAYHTSRYLLRLEQAEYTRERLRWDPISLQSSPATSFNTTASQLSQSEFYAAPQGSNGSVMQLLIRKPLGIIPLLDDECNFPKATDHSFIEKCNHNHTLNDNYQRARTATNQAEFGVRHFGLQARLTWYQVEGFIEKNRDSLRPELVELLLGSKMNVVRDIVRKLSGKGAHLETPGQVNQRTLSRTHDGRYVSMKPRATSVAARFQETLQSCAALEAISCGSTSNEAQLASGLRRAQPWFIFCLQPNRWRAANSTLVFDVAYVEEQAKALNLLELTQIRRLGYHFKLRFSEFVERYRCLVARSKLVKLTLGADRDARGNNNSDKQSADEQRAAVRDVCCAIIAASMPQANRTHYQCGLTKMFLNERFFQHLEQLRLEAYLKATALIQRHLRGWSARQKFLHKRAAAVLVQSWFRGQLARRKYLRELALIVRVQRRWRHQMARKRRMSYELRRRTQRKEQLLELQAQQASLEHQFRFRWARTSERALDIPEELAALYRAQRNWRPLHHLGQLQELELGELRLRERRRRRRHLSDPLSVPFLASASGANPEAMAALIGQLETDEGHSLRDLLRAHYPPEAPQFGYSRLPITRPFSWLKLEAAKRSRLRSGKPRQQVEARFRLIEQQACTIYRLLLRYVDSDFKVSESRERGEPEETSLRLLKFKLLADYLVHLCTREPLLRDELYLQLLSLSWQNPRPQSLENVWRFMAGCLAVFAPTERRLCSVMLRYAHEYCPNHLRRQVLLQIARLILEPSAPSRLYGACLLEYWAQRRMVTRVALAASCYMDDNSLNGSLPPGPEVNPYEASTTNYSSRTLVLVNSRTTGQQLASAALRARQLPAHNLIGWSVEVQHEGAQSELSCRLRGDQVVFDHIAKAETMPEFLSMIEAAMPASHRKTDSWHQQVTTIERHNRCSVASSATAYSNGRRPPSKRLSSQRRSSMEALNHPVYLKPSRANYQKPNYAAAGPPPVSYSAMMLNKRRSMSMQELQQVQSPMLVAHPASHYYADSDVYYQAPSARSHYAPSSVTNGGVHANRNQRSNEYAYYRQPKQQQQQHQGLRRRSQTPTGSMSHYSVRQHRMSAGNESRRSTNSHLNYTPAASGATYAEMSHQQAARKNATRYPPTTGAAPFANTNHRRSSLSSRPPVSRTNDGPNYATPAYTQPLVASKQQQQSKRLPVADNNNVPHYVASSVVSDTSEAPSMASHVRGVQVPQHNDDLDQYLDDLFNPMLDEADLEGEFSDAKSMANSIRVTGLHGSSGLMALCGDTQRLAKALRGTDSPVELATSGGQTNEDAADEHKPALSPTFESLLESLQQQHQQTELASTTGTGDTAIPVAPPPPSFGGPATKAAAGKQEPVSGATTAAGLLTNPTGSVGKLKISSEMKAKLEQLTTSFGVPSGASGTPEPAPTSGIVQQATRSLMEVKRLSEQRRTLLESQLASAASGGGGGQTDHSARNSSGSEFSTGKVLAAKQQLAAAAGLALNQLLPAGSASSRLSAAGSTTSEQQVSNEARAPQEQEPAEVGDSTRARQFKDEELGPQSRAAINQRQAFYQLSMSSDQLNEPALARNQQQVAADAGGSGLQLSRAPQIEANLNEAGRNTALGARCEQLYSSSRSQQQAVGLLQRHQESLKRRNRLAPALEPAHQQWVSSSPEQSVLQQDTAQRRLEGARRPPEVPAAQLAAGEELYMCYANVDWQIKIRKEFFMPSETYEAPLVVQLIFTQLVADVFNPRHWTRLNNKERSAIKALMKDNSIGYAPSLPPIGQMLEVKLELIRMARSFGLYFTRAYPASNFAAGLRNRVSGEAGSQGSSGASSGCESPTDEKESHEEGDIERHLERLRATGSLGELPFDFVAVHHSGLRLVVVETGAGEESSEFSGYKVLETLKYRDMEQVVRLSARQLLVAMRNNRRSWILSSEQANQLAALLGAFHADYNSHTGAKSPAAPRQVVHKQQAARRAGSLQRQQQDALLVGHDGHHGDHFQQRQAPDCVGELRAPAPPDAGLADAGPGVPAGGPAAAKQAAASHRPPPPPPPAAAAAPGAAPGHRRPPLTAAAAEATGGQREQQAAHLQQASLESPAAGPKKQPSSSRWHSSLSRMSNKFALLGARGHQPAAPTGSAGAGSQVALDAWIETKVNYEAEQAANAEEAHSPTGSRSATEQTTAGGGGGGGESLAGSNPHEADGRYSMLQFALYNFREAIDKYSLESRVHNKGQAVGPAVGDTSTLRGSLKLIESIRGADSTGYETTGRKQGARALQAAAAGREWTWRELTEMVKFTRGPLKRSLLKLEGGEQLEKRALECFNALQQYMGDAEPKQNEVECVYLLLMNCHNHPSLRDEVYCQLMKQTTSNRSEQPESCLRGWRLFSIQAAYFDCSANLKPYLFKYLEASAYDKRRAYCSVAALCLENLRKTFKYGGRKNVPSVEEIAATLAGRNSKRQIYRLPGGTERVINTKSTTVVEDIIEEICANMLLVSEPLEMLEFSLYCIADGDLHTMPLNRDEYILDVTTELIKSHQQYFLIFCRSVWFHPLRLDSRLYIEVIFNQIAPDYLEGLLLVLPGWPARSSTRRHSPEPTTGATLRLRSKLVKEVARLGALLHRASGTDHLPHKDEVKYLIPKPIVAAMKQLQRCQRTATFGSTTSSSSTTTTATTPRRGPVGAEDEADLVAASPQMWVELVQANWRDMSAFDRLDAKAQFLDILRHWPLFGSSFFAVQFIQKDLIQFLDFILALNRRGVHMVDTRTHETVHRYPFNEVISTRKVRSEDGALYLDLKCGNLMKRTIIRIRTDQAHEISRLIRQYINIELLATQKQQQHQQQQVSLSQEAPASVSGEPL